MTCKPDVKNPVSKLLYFHPYKFLPVHADGSHADLSLEGQSPSAHGVPLGKVGQVTLYCDKILDNHLTGIQMKDREGKTLFHAGGGDLFNTHAYELNDDEVIVGFKSQTDGRLAHHWDFQLIVMRDIRVEEL